MSPQVGAVLLEQIAPRLKGAVPYIKPVGCEDKEELYQEGLCMAAHLLDANEKNGKHVPPSSVAYYTILHLKSGRRSQGSSKLDVMAPQAQICGNTAVHSLEEEFGLQGSEFDGPVTLGEMLTGNSDDPSMIAARNLDWASFLGELDKHQLVMLGDVAVGDSPAFTLRKRKVTYDNIRQVRRSMVDEAKKCFGEDVLADVAKNPRWWGDLHAERERSACKVH